MLAHQRAVGSKEEHTTVKSALITLDDSNHEIHGIGPRRLAQSVNRRTWYLDGAVPITEEILAAFGGT